MVKKTVVDNKTSFLKRLASIGHHWCPTLPAITDGNVTIDGVEFYVTSGAAGSLALVMSGLAVGRKPHLQHWYDRCLPYSDYGRMTKEIYKHGSHQLVEEAFALLSEQQRGLFLHTYEDRVLGMTQAWTPLHESALFQEWSLLPTDEHFIDLKSETYGVRRWLDNSKNSWIQFESGFTGRVAAGMSINVLEEFTFMAHGKPIREQVRLSARASRRKHLSRVAEVYAAWDEAQENPAETVGALRALRGKIESACADMTPTKARLWIGKLIRDEIER